MHDMHTTNHAPYSTHMRNGRTCLNTNEHIRTCIKHSQHQHNFPLYTPAAE